MAIAYYGVKLSDNWIETPEGYVIFKNAVIGRTGFQKYKGSELNQEELQQQGVTVGPDEEVELFRSYATLWCPSKGDPAGRPYLCGLGGGCGGRAGMKSLALPP